VHKARLPKALRTPWDFVHAESRRPVNAGSSESLLRFGAPRRTKVTAVYVFDRGPAVSNEAMPLVCSELIVQYRRWDSARRDVQPVHGTTVSICVIIVRKVVAVYTFGSEPNTRESRWSGGVFPLRQRFVVNLPPAENSQAKGVLVATESAFILGAFQSLHL